MTCVAFTKVIQLKDNKKMQVDTQKLNGKKILLVEDDTFYVDLVAKKFSSLQCNFSWVGTGEEAWKILQKETPDVVLLDMMLPGSMSGFDVLKKMREKTELKNVPVIVLSNLSSMEDIEKGMKLGAFRYLVKASITPSEIVGHVASVFA